MSDIESQVAALLAADSTAGIDFDAAARLASSVTPIAKSFAERETAQFASAMRTFGRFSDATLAAIRAVICGEDVHQKPWNDSNWYNQDESTASSSAMYTDSSNTAEDYDQKREAELIRRNVNKQRQQQRLRQNNEHETQWQVSRLNRAGIDQIGVSRTFDDMMESDEPVSLIVRSTRAPFLSSPDDPAIPNSGYEPVSLVRDPACDMARLAKRGSQIVHDKRNERERQRATASAIEVNQSNNSSSNISSIGNSTDNDTAAALTTLGDYVEEKTQSAADILKQRQSLPAYASKNELLRSIRDNQVVIIVGETGSGKTTQLTQYLYSDGFTSNGGMIACTQPRRVAAVSVAERVSIEMDSGSVGGLVGYSIRFEDLTSPKTKIKYMTDGILVREALADPYLDRYSVIIIDEAHERALSTDILLGLLKRATSARSDLRLVVTSATLDAQRFASFFGNAPIIHISGRTFPVDINYSLAPADDYVASSVQQALAIHASQPPGDILIFLPGREEVEVACSVMAERLAKLDRAKPLLILPAYSMLRSDLQQRIFAPAPQGSRKCVIATNIAETSLTIDGIRYVVDPGYAKIKAFNPRIGIDSLQVAPISQASANQRAGRAGRTAAGVCFRLYSEDAFMRDLLPATVPEIQRTSLASSVLLLLALGVSDITSFPLIDPPPKAAFHDALQRLWILGAVDATGSLTDVGREMAALPLDPVLARMLVDAIHHNCTAEVLTIVSMLSVPQVFARPRAQLEQADAARERFCVPESDHLSLLNVFKQWTTNSRSTVWCNKNFISSRSMYQAEDVRKQLADIISRKYGDEAVLQTCGRDWDVVRRVVCRSLFHQAAKMTRIGEYADMRTGLPCYLHPTSSLFGMGLAAPYVVYSELIFTQKEYMQCVTAVEPRWLAEAGPMFYTIEGEEPVVSMVVEEKKDVNDNSTTFRRLKLPAQKSKRSNIMVTALTSVAGVDGIDEDNNDDDDDGVVTFGRNRKKRRR